MPTNVLYRTTARATGGRDGRATSLDSNFEARLAMPKELGGSGGEGVNPEILFASGYAACFLGALKFVASKEGLNIPVDASVAAEVGIGPRDEGGFGLDVALKISLPGIHQSSAEALVAKAHEVCPYSNATRNNLDVRLQVI